MVNIGRISTLGIHTRTLSDFGSVQRHMVELQQQISSGVKANRFDEMAGDIEQFTGLEARVKKLSTYENNNTESISRLRTMRESVSHMVEIADDLQDLLVLRRAPAGDKTLAFSQQVDGKTGALINELNLRIEGRYVFSGTRSNVSPVRDPLPGPAETGIPDDNYYQGSKENIIIRPQDNFETSYPARADDEAFQKIFAAIDLCYKGHAENDDDMLAQAYDLVTDGMEDLVRVQTAIDAQVLELEQINERHESQRLYFQGVIEDINKTDVLSASTQVALDETILNATFQVFGRVTRLSLNDYL
jgi:flagellar hook-associated protein 3 FlgL